MNKVFIMQSSIIHSINQSITVIEYGNCLYDIYIYIYRYYRCRELITEYVLLVMLSGFLWLISYCNTTSDAGILTVGVILVMIVIVAYSVNHINDDIREEKRIVKLFASQERFRQVIYRKRKVIRKRPKGLKRRRLKMKIDGDEDDDGSV